MGNADDDILIGGLTQHDRTRAALLAIMLEWTRTDGLSAEESYQQRIDNLKNGTGLNGPFTRKRTNRRPLRPYGDDPLDR